MLCESAKTGLIIGLSVGLPLSFCVVCLCMCIIVYCCTKCYSRARRARQFEALLRDQKDVLLEDQDDSEKELLVFDLDAEDGNEKLYVTINMEQMHILDKSDLAMHIDMDDMSEFMSSVCEDEEHEVHPTEVRSDTVLTTWMRDPETASLLEDEPPPAITPPRTWTVSPVRRKRFRRIGPEHVKTKNMPPPLPPRRSSRPQLSRQQTMPVMSSQQQQSRQSVFRQIRAGKFTLRRATTQTRRKRSGSKFNPFPPKKDSLAWALEKKIFGIRGEINPDYEEDDDGSWHSSDEASVQGM